ncbi:hypothetical protein ACQQ6K_004559 [Escherichia coli]|uniref:Uncharacterized protein n=4 Tax=Enterobacteriaceae TaxID=543 RepID=A0A2H5C0C5_ECOLX|nr:MULTISPECIES: hypothetical protein [Enterobacteriaceae]AFR24525.1 hypothetical protein pSH696_34_6 [Salmonella enterica subsp. enterica serovar Heidelberg]AFR24627.1 hypothetical protein pSH163_34_7 [Salmonella enterica subsp. enterica serovar Heidelberg]AUH16409.1 hypothetical protein PCOV8_00033 [Escherichia coli]MCN3431171.1 hypothetical protein [Escherichia coli]MCN6306509.1 hypothetical protein [Escherichia coli]
MMMKKGVKKVALATLETKDLLCAAMIDAGVDPKQALLASTVATKAHVDVIIDRVFGNQSAADITRGLSEVGRGTRPLN